MTEEVQCRDGCKRTQPNEEAAANAGWMWLEVQKRWRCPTCMRELQEANLAMVKYGGMRLVLDADIVPGVVVRHPRTGDYIIQSMGQMRLPSGEWVRAARYCSLHDVTCTEFYRAVSDFGNFLTKVTHDERSA